jgi:hypothetical protein
MKHMRRSARAFVLRGLIRRLKGSGTKLQLNLPSTGSPTPVSMTILSRDGRSNRLP